MEFQFASRMDQFQAGIFSVLDQKRREVEASGRKVYNLSIGTEHIDDIIADLEKGFAAAK